MRLIKDMWPTKGSKMFKILEAINELSAQCIGGRVPVAELYIKLDGDSRESTRMMISNLKRHGLIETPVRGMYVLTEAGKNLLSAKPEEVAG